MWWFATKWILLDTHMWAVGEKASSAVQFSDLIQFKVLLLPTSSLFMFDRISHVFFPQPLTSFTQFFPSHSIHRHRKQALLSLNILKRFAPYVNTNTHTQRLNKYCGKFNLMSLRSPSTSCYSSAAAAAAFFHTQYRCKLHFLLTLSARVWLS